MAPAVLDSACVGTSLLPTPVGARLADAVQRLVPLPDPVEGAPVLTPLEATYGGASVEGNEGGMEVREPRPCRITAPPLPSFTSPS